MAAPLKSEVREFWEASPCGAADAVLTPGTREFFEEVEKQRYTGEDFMRAIVGFDRWRGKP
jgi:hypothetical protein